MRPRRSVVLKSGCVVISLVFWCVAVGAQTVNTAPRVTEAVNMKNRVPLKGNTIPFARPEYDRGLVPDSLPMQRMLLVLKRSVQQEAGLAELLRNQQDKSSSQFHKWLTPEQFGQLFGPADADIRAVTDWLTSQGFQINNVSRGRTVIEFSGNAGLVRSAFGTEIHKYVVNGEEHWANASDPQIPAALTPVVFGVESLNNFPLSPMHHVIGTVSRSRATGEIKPVTGLFTFSGCYGACDAVGPYDFATIYNVLPLWNKGINGKGEIIAIAGDSDINIQDAANFRTLFGLPANNPQIIVNGSDPGVTGDETEADLDVQWAGAVAPSAAIDLVVSASVATNGVLLSAQYIVDNNFAPVMSVSFGACELFIGATGNQQISQLWQQAAAQGITVMVAAGDQGSAACDGGNVPYAVGGLAVSGVASTPYDVAVGGTDFDDLTNSNLYWNSTNNSTTQASAKGYIPETVWNNSCTSPLLIDFGFSADPENTCNDSVAQQDGLLVVTGGGGGFSSCTTASGSTASSCLGGYSKPSWQKGTGVPGDGARDIPDVALFSGDLFGSFYVVCAMDQDASGQSCNLNSPYTNFLAIGGTSAASPTFAGIMALVNQATGSRQGNANPILYALAAGPGSTCASTGNPAGSCIFYDVTSGTNAMPCLKGSPSCTTSNPGDSYGVLPSYSATAGYDQATGLGSVNAANLVTNWNAAAPSLGPASFSILSNTLTIQVPAPGQSASAIITVTSLGDFTGSVVLACSIAPTPTIDPLTCSFSPGSVTLAAGTSATATLSVQSTGSTSTSFTRRFDPNEPNHFAVKVAILLLCVSLPIAWKKSRSSALLGLAAVIFVVAMAGCASNSGGGSTKVTPGTPSGNYVVAITATSGNISQTTNVFVSIP
jgi:subtilase family serine protease